MTGLQVTRLSMLHSPHLQKYRCMGAPVPLAPDLHPCNSLLLHFTHAVLLLTLTPLPFSFTIHTTPSIPHHPNTPPHSLIYPILRRCVSTISSRVNSLPGSNRLQYFGCNTSPSDTSAGIANTPNPNDPNSRTMWGANAI